MIWSTLYGDIKQFIRERIQRSALYGIQGFWNIAYFDQPYFNGMFEDFVFPDGTRPCWDSVNWLQKDFMKWFNAERLKTSVIEVTVLTRYLRVAASKMNFKIIHSHLHWEREVFLQVLRVL